MGYVQDIPVSAEYIMQLVHGTRQSARQAMRGVICRRCCACRSGARGLRCLGTYIPTYCSLSTLCAERVSMAMAHFHHRHSHDYGGTMALYSVCTLGFVCSDCTYIQYPGPSLAQFSIYEPCAYLARRNRWYSCCCLRHEYEGDKLRCLRTA
jgi:hypothetical protein